MKKFTEIFKNSNDYNEKTVIGFLSFAIMVIVMLVDVITGFFGILFLFLTYHCIHKQITMTTKY